MSADFTRQADSINDKIISYGQKAILRRNGMADRFCHIFVSMFTPMEMMGRTLDPLDRKIVMASTAEILTNPPIFGKDRIITLQQPVTSDNVVEIDTLRIIEQVQPVSPGGTTIYWRLRCQPTGSSS